MRKERREREKEKIVREREREDSEGERVKFITEGIERGGERRRGSVRERVREEKDYEES